MYLPINEDFLHPVIVSTTGYETTSLHEQGSGESNEDRLLLRDGLYGVFDGATSLGSKQLFAGLSGGAMAAQIARDTFSSAEGSLFDGAVEANRRIAIGQISAGKDLSKRDSLWSTSMAVVRVVGDQLEFCQTGDSLVMLLYTDGSHSLLTPEVDIDCETLKLWQTVDSKDKAENSIYSKLGHQIRKVRLQMNREYGVLNGEPEAVSFLRHGNVSLSLVTDVILFTDGLYLPKKNPEQPTDWSEFIKLYRERGLAGLGGFVRDKQSSDPSLNVYPRFKLHDDIAALSLRFSDVLLERYKKAQVV